MSKKTKIEWCDHTFNPVRGCTKVSPGCEHCYAAREAVRFPGMRGIWGNAGTRIAAVPDAWKEPRRWDRRSVESWRPRVFCASLADVFEDWKGDLRFPAEFSPQGWVTARWDGSQMVRELDDAAEREGLARATMDNLRTELFRLIEETPGLDWLLLTKRPQNVMRMVPEFWRGCFPANVWMGTTVEDQARADERIPELLRIPARVRFLSCEPLLGPVDLNSNLGGTRWMGGQRGCTGMHRGKGAPDCPRELHHHHDERCKRGIEWVICGGESGPHARPMHPEWARSLRDQCYGNSVPFFFKQWGEWVSQSAGDQSIPLGDAKQGITLRHSGGGVRDGMFRIGKKASGRVLDGREWSEFPITGQPQFIR
jgi:protein gp37